jgi:protein disulfide-isomerase
MKNIYILVLLLLILVSCKVDGPYDEDADAIQLISKAIAEAKVEKLPVVIIFGANWCPDCRGLSETIAEGKNAKLIAKEFKVVKVNVGNFDTNLEIANKYSNPISGGIPGAAILSFDEKLIYVTKPGELANARSQGDDGLYTFLKKAAQT